MTDPEAKAILNSYGAPVNIAKHIEAINTAIRALGGKATMAEIWRWASDGSGNQTDKHCESE